MSEINQNITKKDFFNILTYAKEQQSKIIPLFKYFYNVCIENNINFCLCEGSLLGAVRHKKMIPWDDDIDICMTKESLAQLIGITDYSIISIEKNNFQFYFYRNKNNRYKIDIFLYSFKKGLYLRENYINTNFENCSVLIPDNFETILSLVYKDWNKICYISNHKIASKEYNTDIAYTEKLIGLYKYLSVEQAQEWTDEFNKTQN